jgi:hypothetical protein
MYARGYHRAPTSHYVGDRYGAAGTAIGAKRLITLADLDAEGDSDFRVGTIGQRGTALHLLQRTPVGGNFHQVCGTVGYGARPVDKFDTDQVTCVSCRRQLARRTDNYNARRAREAAERERELARQVAVERWLKRPRWQRVLIRGSQHAAQIVVVVIVLGILAVVGSNLFSSITAPPTAAATTTSKISYNVPTHNIGSGCGSRGGPGFRLPSGKCASWRDTGRGHR